MFAQGEAAAVHLIHRVDDDEGLGVHLLHQMVQLGQLPVGDDGEHHVPLVAGVAGLGVQQGAAPVQYLQNQLANLVALFAEDLHLDLGVAHQHHLVQHDGVEQHQQDAVEDLLPVFGEEHLPDEDGKVQPVHDHRDGHTPELVGHNGRNVHTAAGSARADHQADGRADHHTGEHGGQHGVAGHVANAGNPAEQLQEDGVAEGGHRRVEGKPAAHDRRAQNEHNHVGDHHEGGDGDAQPVLADQGQAGGTAGNQPAGEHEHVHRQGIKGVARQHQQQVPQPARHLKLFHPKRPPFPSLPNAFVQKDRTILQYK